MQDQEGPLLYHPVQPPGYFCLNPSFALDVQVSPWIPGAAHPVRVISLRWFVHLLNEDAEPDEHLYGTDPDMVLTVSLFYF